MNFNNFTNNPAPLIVNLAPTGMVPTRQLSAKVPLQPKEIVRDVVNAANLGITMVHLHARDEQDKPSHLKEIYAQIIGGIREQHPDLIIGVSCSGREVGGFEERSDVLNLSNDLQPDMASLTLSSMNFAKQASINSPDMIRRLLDRMLEKNILPEFEIFDLGMVNYACYLVDSAHMTGPFYANIMLGNIAGAQANFSSIAAITSNLSDRFIWGLGGMGTSQIAVSALATVTAPAVRVGLEDNLWMDRRREQPASNQEMVERIHNLASQVDRLIMKPNDLRTLLNLKKHSHSN
jgi:3-keto-5-aminohexanoate cleavage enzyme